MFCERPERFSGERNKYSCFFLLAFLLFFHHYINLDACVRPINKCTPLKCQSMPFFVSVSNSKAEKLESSSARLTAVLMRTDRDSRGGGGGVR